MGYDFFDTTQLRLKPLAERKHDMQKEEILELGPPADGFSNQDLDCIAERIVAAKKRGSAVIGMMGAHVIKTGMSRFIIDLIAQGYFTQIGFNGACAIHDYELARIGATTESVARYIQEGQFGLWQETGSINDLAKTAVNDGIGLGEALGREIAEGEYPYKDLSILAAGYQHGVPVNIHVAIGQDIIHEHPNCDGAALGASSYRDFLVLVKAVEQLEGGVLLNIGTAVMGPEVYLKALSMARNVALQRGEEICHFTTAVFDIQPLVAKDLHQEPPKSDPRYYHRYWKTVLVRTVQDGGESYYIEGDHRHTIAALWDRVTKEARIDG